MTKQEKLLKSDFRVFLALVWRYLNLPPPTQVQYDIALYLQFGHRRDIIQGYRGVGKSFITSAFVIWRLYINPQIKALIVSASKERADSFSLFTKRLLREIPILHFLIPSDNQRTSNISYDVYPAIPDHSPSVKSVGIMGQLTGSRADLIIADDIETPSNCMTQAMRDKLSELVKEFDAILKPLPESRIIYLGTPQIDQSLYNTLTQRGYKRRIWTVLYPANSSVYNGELAEICDDESKAGTPTDPLRFDEEELLERKLSYGASGFTLQFMLDTSLADMDKSPLKISDMMIMALDNNIASVKFAWCNDKPHLINNLPNVAYSQDNYFAPLFYSEDMTEYTGSIMAIDPSGRGKDETGYAIIKHLAGNLFLLDAGGLKGGYDESTLKILSQKAKNYDVHDIIVEANFGDGMYTQLLKPILAKYKKCNIEEVKHHKQKELRIIDTLEPVLSNHRLIVNKKIIELDYATAKDVRYSLIYQLTRITKDKGSLVHDDRLDAVAIGVNFWTEYMAQNQDRALEVNRERLKDAELKRFKEHVFGARPKRTNWAS